ncbi:hypothetical protein VNO77_35722 [Canavalia gladiata]|uniref:Terpene synthase metal-binding domain-containing protein n=1 Tax=Canavalia gladiata TaxID=3824 RepID=A0AAN9K760_CANGL
MVLFLSWLFFYAYHSTNVDTVYSHITETTRHPAASAAFASIMFAPQAELSFYEALSRCRKNNVPICLMYGKEDPWVKPFWGQQVKRQVPEAPYYQVSPAGHCPHDEAPEVINFLPRGWIRNLESQGCISLPLVDDVDSIEHSNGRELEFIRDGSRKTAVQCRWKQPITTTAVDNSDMDEIEHFLHTFEDLVYNVSLVIRLCNDLGTTVAERERGDDASSILCYMNEKFVSEETARKHMQDIINKAWKKINGHCMTRVTSMEPFLTQALNAARVAHTLYQYGDGFGIQDRDTRKHILSIFVEPL